MSKCIVDTNVPIVASRRSPQASAACIQACVGKLRSITSERETLVLDDNWWIIKEYLRNLDQRGQPGVGDAFLKWVLTNYRNPSRCVLVNITPVNSEGSDFQEFPKDPCLAGYDPEDRKFVAVSAVHPDHPAIAQAVDRRWWGLRCALKNNGIRVDFLCPSDISSSP